MRFLLLFLSLLCGFAASAQSSPGKGSISGVVINASTGGPIDCATVSLYPDSSSKPVNGSITDSNGDFLIKGINRGSYMLVTDFISYRRDTLRLVLDGSSARATDTIRLRQSARTLSGVTVSASAPLIENKVDKIVFNAANDITSQGSITLDLLRKVPQVTVDIDGNVELQGNPNIRFLINGKPSSIFGASLADALASIPASQIQRIEAIATPGARYDAQGTGGIINIILKESKVQGYNGSINISAGTLLENGSFNLNWRKGNIGLNAFFSGNAQLLSHALNNQDRRSLDTTTQATTQLLQNGYYDLTRVGYQGGAGFDWNAGKRDDWTGGLLYNHLSSHTVGAIHQESITRDKSGAQIADISGERTSDRLFYTNSLDWNLSYKHKLAKEGQEFEITYDASYAAPDVSYTQSQTEAGKMLPSLGSASYNPGTELQTNIAVDFTQPLGEKASLETGIKMMLDNINSNAEVTTLNTGSNEYRADPAQSYQFKYRMAVYAGYVSTSFSLGRFADVKTGVRYEYTRVNINFPGTTIPDYGLVVPTIILSHRFAGEQMLKLAYTRRVERAEYSEVNPFVDRSDPYNIATGNPLLKPELGNNLELGWNKSFGKGSYLNMSLIERINSQDHKRVVDFYNSYAVGDSVYENVSVQRVQNAGVEYNTGINVSGSLHIWELFTLRGNVMAMNQYFMPTLPGLRSGSIGYRFRGNLNLSYQPAGSSFAAEAFGNYNAPTQNIQGRSQQNLSYTIAVRKLFWNRKGSLGLVATNPFNWYVHQVTTVSTPGYESYVERQVPYRSFGVVFGYKFGKLEVKKEREEDRGYLNDVPGGN